MMLRVVIKNKLNTLILRSNALFWCLNEKNRFFSFIYGKNDSESFPFTVKLPVFQFYGNIFFKIDFFYFMTIAKQTAKRAR